MKSVEMASFNNVTAYIEEIIAYYKVFNVEAYTNL